MSSLSSEKSPFVQTPRFPSMGNQPELCRGGNRRRLAANLRKLLSLFFRRSSNLYQTERRVHWKAKTMSFFTVFFVLAYTADSAFSIYDLRKSHTPTHHQLEISHFYHHVPTHAFLRHHFLQPSSFFQMSDDLGTGKFDEVEDDDESEDDEKESESSNTESAKNEETNAQHVVMPPPRKQMSWNDLKNRSKMLKVVMPSVGYSDATHACNAISCNRAMTQPNMKGCSRFIHCSRCKGAASAYKSPEQYCNNWKPSNGNQLILTHASLYSEDVLQNLGSQSLELNWENPATPIDVTKCRPDSRQLNSTWSELMATGNVRALPIFVAIGIHVTATRVKKEARKRKEPPGSIRLYLKYDDGQGKVITMFDSYGSLQPPLGNATPTIPQCMAKERTFPATLVKENEASQYVAWFSVPHDKSFDISVNNFRVQVNCKSKKCNLNNFVFCARLICPGTDQVIEQYLKVVQNAMASPIDAPTEDNIVAEKKEQPATATVKSPNPSRPVYHQLPATWGGYPAYYPAYPAGNIYGYPNIS